MPSALTIAAITSRLRPASRSSFKAQPYSFSQAALSSGMNGSLSISAISLATGVPSANSSVPPSTYSKRALNIREAAPDAGTNLHTSPPWSRYSCHLSNAALTSSSDSRNMPASTRAASFIFKYGNPVTNRDNCASASDSLIPF